jgi:DNA-nicking Smr family endonuclease
VDEGTVDDEPAVEVPIDGCLDLHTFRPAEVREVVEAYLEACREKGILEVRVVHGKGTGALRRGVHAVLERLAWIHKFHNTNAERDS